MSIQTPDWVKDAVFYQIFPDRFASSERLTKPANLESWAAVPTRRGFKGGDLLGVLEHLDYLEALGVNALYFNPIFESPANHRYHTHDYFKVDPILGGNAAFTQLLEEAHKRGIRVMLDGVFNHTGRGFLQFNNIMENGPQSPYLDWFTVKGFPLNAFDEKKRPNYECWWNNRELPKLNTESQQVRGFICEVAEYWLKMGIDGWRLDVPLEIKTPGFWEEFRQRVKRINPEAYILAEIWEEAQPWLQGKHFDAVMDYPFNRACLGFFGDDALNTKFKPGGFKLSRLNAKSFARQIDRILNLYDWEVIQVQFNLLSSHDEPRFLSLVGGDKQRLRLATLFQMTFPGAPSIYYGDEIGMEGEDDPDCRRAFPWDSRWWDQELLEDFRRYTILRHEHPALRRGSYTTLFANGQTYAFARQTAEETVVIVLNAGHKPEALTLNLKGVIPDGASLVEAWSGERLSPEQGKVALTAAPLSSSVWVVG